MSSLVRQCRQWSITLPRNAVHTSLRMGMGRHKIHLMMKKGSYMGIHWILNGLGRINKNQFAP